MITSLLKTMKHALSERALSKRKFSRPKQHGQALTELAVSMTFLLVMLAGVVDLGRVFYTYITMRDAAQEGLAYGSVGYVAVANKQQPANQFCNQIINRTAEAMHGIPAVVDVTIIDGSGNTIACTPGTVMGTNVACFSRQIRVETKYDDYPLVMPLISTFTGSQSVDLSSTITGTIVGPPCQ